MLCQRPRCGAPVPEGRRKYCSDRCARIVNRDSSAARARRRMAAIEAKGGPHVAPRICLSCSHPFLSEGPWNRICGNCSERNSAYSYSRSEGSALSPTDQDDAQTAPAPIDVEEPANL